MSYRPSSTDLKDGRARRLPGAPPAALLALLILLLPATALLSGCHRDGDGSRQAAAAADTMADTPWMELSAAQILIAYDGCRNAPPDLHRTRGEAENLAMRLVSEARDGAEFEDLALKYSDEPDVEQTEGHMGIFLPTDMNVDFVAKLMSLKIGEIGVHETPLGFHVIKRLAPERVRTHHILIAWRGATRAPETVTRTEPQAAALAAEVQRMAAAEGADLCELTRRFSDDVSSRIRCGDLGLLERRMLPPEVERVLFRLKAGRVSDPVRSEFGYHILWREP